MPDMVCVVCSPSPATSTSRGGRVAGRLGGLGWVVGGEGREDEDPKRWDRHWILKSSEMRAFRQRWCVSLRPLIISSVSVINDCTNVTLCLLPDCQRVDPSSPALRVLLLSLPSPAQLLASLVSHALPRRRPLRSPRRSPRENLR